MRASPDTENPRTEKRTMRAITIVGEGELELAELPEPTPGPGEVLVDVVAAGVNRADLAQTAGQYPPPPGASELPGLEVSGRRRDTGEEVVALLAGGGYAEVVAVPEAQLLPAPEGMLAFRRGRDLVCAVNFTDRLRLAGVPFSATHPFGHRDDLDDGAGAPGPAWQRGQNHSTRASVPSSRGSASSSRWMRVRQRARQRNIELPLILSDHGNDPTWHGTDHTREHGLLLAYRPGMGEVDLGDRETFADVGATVADALGATWEGPGESFWKRLN